MSKQDLAMYLVNLVTIMQSKETAGRARGETLANEYNKCYKDFINLLKEEHENETRS